MSLQDEHLQQALKQAPDHDLAPSDAVREKVFAHVEATAKQKENRFVRWFNGLSRLHWMGMSTLASAVIVMLMVYPQAPDDAIWSGEQEADIALSEAMDLEVAEAPQVSAAPQAVETSRGADETVVADKVVEEESVPAPVEFKAKKAVKETKRQRLEKTSKLEAPNKVGRNELEKKSAPQKVDEAESDTDRADTMADQPVVATTDAAATTEVKPAAAPAPKSVPAKQQALQQRSGLASAFSSNASLAIVLAQQDIEAGRFRILVAAEDWTEGQVKVDQETGFAIEMSDMSATEVADYNKVVRDWYRKNRTSK